MPQATPSISPRHSRRMAAAGWDAVSVALNEVTARIRTLR